MITKEFTKSTTGFKNKPAYIPDTEDTKHEHEDKRTQRNEAAKCESKQPGYKKIQTMTNTNQEQRPT